MRHSIRRHPHLSSGHQAQAAGHWLPQFYSAKRSDIPAPLTTTRISGGEAPWLTGFGDLVGRCEAAEQERQEPGQPGAEQTEVVARSGEDEVGRVARNAEQEVAAEAAVTLQVADDRLDGAAATPLAANGRGDAALLAGDEDAGLVGVVAAVAAVDIGSLDLDTCDALGLDDLGGEGVAVKGVARQGAGAEDELPAGRHGVAGGDRDLHTELVAGLGLALADAFHLGRVQRVELVAAAVLAPLPEQPRDAPERAGKDGLGGGVVSDLAADVAEQPPEPGAQLPDLPLRPTPAAGADEPGSCAPSPSGHSQVGLAQPDAVPAGQPRQDLDAAVEQLAVGGGGHRFGLDRGVDGDAAEVLLLHRAAPPCRVQALGGGGGVGAAARAARARAGG